MSLNQPRELVSVLDPAVDKLKTDLKRYVDTRDVSHLVYKPGMQPTRFFVRHLTTKLFNGVIEAAPTQAMRYQLAFIFGVVEVHNHNGLAKYVPQGEPNLNAGLPAHYTEDQLEDFAPARVQEIGEVIYTSAFLGRGSTVEYRLLPSLLSHLQAAVVQDAESTRPASPSKSSDDKSHPEPSTDVSEG